MPTFWFIDFFFNSIANFVIAIIYYYAWAKNTNPDAPEERFALEDLTNYNSDDSSISLGKVEIVEINILTTPDPYYDQNTAYLLLQ